MFRTKAPESEETGMLRNERGASQRILLLVLLLLVAVFGYLYFFTGLITPRGGAPAPAVVSQVKKPIPPRPAVAPTEGAVPTVPGQTEPAKPAASVPAPAPSPQAVAPAPAKQAAAPAPAKQAAAPAPAKQAAAPAPAKQAAAPAPAKQAVAPAPAKQAAAPAPAKQAVAPAPAKQAVAPAPAKQAAAPAPAKQAAAPAKPETKEGAFVLTIDGIVGDEAASKVSTHLKRSGISPVRKVVAKKPESMVRLFVADFSDHDVAEQELEKLRKVTPDAFLLREGSSFSLYGGSYHLQEKAANQQKRLSGKGVSVQLLKATVVVPVTKFKAGNFTSRAEAIKKSDQLKKQGVHAVVTKG